MSKAHELKNALKSHNSILAFDNTIITLFYIQKILKDEGIECYTLAGNTQKDGKLIGLFELGSSHKNIIGLCSDSVSEGVNMQQASALFHLDMPSVLRIAEQRVGRLERLDSPHAKIQIYWPDDSNEFALKTDKKLIKTLNITETLIGSNLELPTSLNPIKAKEYIKQFEIAQKDALVWDGIKDAYSHVRELFEGENTLISDEEYINLKDVKVDIKCKLSIGQSESQWMFLALKGTKSRPSKWFFINNYEICTDVKIICNYLRKELNRVENWEEDWDKAASNGVKSLS